jgi:hypothetical protein
MVVLYGRTGCLTAKNGGFRPGQYQSILDDFAKFELKDSPPPTPSRRPVPPAKRPYTGRLRKHAGCQTEEAETGELKHLRETALDAQRGLVRIVDRVEATSIMARDEYNGKLEENLLAEHQKSSALLVHERSMSEAALVRTRLAAQTECQHELARMRAAQLEAIQLLRDEYEAKYRNETMKLVQSEEHLKTKVDEQAGAIKDLREKLEEYRRQNTSLVARAEFDALRDDVKHKAAEIKVYKKELGVMTSRWKVEKQRAEDEKVRADAAERLEAQRALQLADTKSAAEQGVVRMQRECEHRTLRLSRELEEAGRGLAANRAELTKERQLRTLVSDRQVDAINRLVAENGQVRKMPSWPRSWANFSLL